MLSIADQDRRLRAKFPQFRVVSMADMRGIWEGRVRQSDTDYNLRIDYELPPHFALRGPTREFYPRVYVIEPRLRLNPSAELGPLPHVWYDKKFEKQPNLCLFHPEKGEWVYGSSIAETTLPDACEWLHNYELWLANGRWYGGGENHETPNQVRTNDLQKIRRDALSGASEIAVACR
jgi:hypothetical protein